MLKGYPMHISDAPSTATASLSPTLMRAATDAVDAALASEFPADPLLGRDLSTLLSTTASIVKRHGPLIEKAIAEALATAGLIVETNVRFPITAPADDVVNSQPTELLRGLHLRLASEPNRSVDVDVLAVDEVRSLAIAATIKRGGGATEARKRRPLEKDMRAVGLLLRSYVRQLGYGVDDVRIAIVDYYGLGGFSGDLVVKGPDLDRFFTVPVTSTVTALTAHLRSTYCRHLPNLVARVANAELKPKETNSSGGPLVSDDIDPIATTRRPLSKPFRRPVGRHGVPRLHH
jgi:hypothetical protein